MATAETKAKKWTSTAGPRQTKQVDDAMRALQRESQTYTEVTDYGQHSLQNLFGPGRAEAATYTLAIGDQYDWTITRENFKSVILAYETATAELFKSRPVIDKRTTPEEREERARALRESEAKRNAESLKKQNDIATFVAELRAKYPWAKADDKKTSEHARASANLKAELSREFPGIQFSVKSSSFSGGNSLDVKWTNGPTSEEVNAILGKYKYGSFDGMIDMYESDNSAYGTAVGIVLGRAKYVHGSRDIDTATRELVGRALCEKQRVEFNGDSTRNVFGDSDGRCLSDHVYQMLAKCSLPAGATITGIEDDFSDSLGAYRITFTAPERPATGTASDDATPITGNGYVIEKRFHTKKQFDFWIVVLDRKVDTPTYQQLLSTCKRAGGWYSRAWAGESGGFAFDNAAAASTWAAENIK